MAPQNHDADEQAPDIKDEAKAIMDEVEYQIVPQKRGALTPPARPQPSKEQANWLFSLLMRAIADTDLQAAEERVAALRADMPEATTEQIVEYLIKQKCQQTGAIGAATSGAALLPGLGTLTSMTLGVAADIGATFKLQAELVLEIAATHRYPLSELEKRQIVMLITGVSAGGNQMLTRAGQELSLKVTEKYAKRWVVKALPVIGVIASASTNALSTYIIGQRADAYFGRGPEALVDWRESLRALVGVDERKVTGWLAERGNRSLETLRRSAEGATEVGKRLAEGVGNATSSVVEAGKGAGDAIVGAGQNTLGKLGDAAEAAREGVANTTRRVTGRLRREPAALEEGAPPLLPAPPEAQETEEAEGAEA